MFFYRKLPLAVMPDKLLTITTLKGKVMNNNLTETWQGAREYLAEELSPMVYREYIEDVIPYYMDDETIVLKFDAEYKRNLVRSAYDTLVRKAVRYASSGKNYNVIYIVSNSEFDPKSAGVGEDDGAVYSDPHSRIQQRFNPKYTFDTFVVGSNNRLAKAASEAVAEEPGKKYNPLFIYGGVGLGKTHLMQAIAQYALKENPHLRVVFVTSEKFTNEFIEAIRNETNLAFRNKYRTVDMLLIDDIQFLSNKEGTQEEFFHTFNDLYNAGKQIVLTSDKTPKEIPFLADRLKSRFEQGLICDIGVPDYETRCAILRQKAKDVDFTVSDEIVDYIAANLGSNIRELEGALSRVKAMSEMNGGIEPELSEVKEAFSDIIVSRERRVTPEMVINAVARRYSVSYSDILSSKRTSNVALARMIAMYLTRELTDFSLPSIGDFFGRNHSTVIHAVNKIKEDMDKDPSFRKDVEAAASALKDSGYEM